MTRIDNSDHSAAARGFIVLAPVPFTERLADKLADLLIAAGDVIDAAGVSSGACCSGEERLAAWRAERSGRLTSIYGDPDDTIGPYLRTVSFSRDGQNLPILLTASENDHDARNAFQRATAARVALAAEDIFESINRLMQEITD